MKNVLTKIIVVLAAILFWYLIVSGQNYTSVIDLPLEVYEPRQDKTLGKPLPETIRVRVEGPGRAVSFLRFQKKAALVLDVGAITSFERISLKGYFQARPNQVLLTQDLNFLEVVYPDSIDIFIEDLALRKIPVQVLADISLRPGYIQTSAAEAESVTVEGPISALEKIGYISTTLLKFENADLPFEIEMPLVNPNPKLLKISPELSKVQVDIEVIGERSIPNIPVQIRNQPTDLQISAIPGTVTLQISGGNSRIQKLDASDFSVYFDYLTQWLPNKHYYVPRVIEAEDVLDLKGIDPPQIEIVVSRKEHP